MNDGALRAVKKLYICLYAARDNSQLFHPSRRVLSPRSPLKPYAGTQGSVIEQDSQALDQVMTLRMMVKLGDGL
jgi:hypothetical protein